MVFGEGKHYQRCAKQFQQLAGNHEQIPLVELQARLQERRSSLDLDDRQIEVFLKQADTNNDKFISFPEFTKLMASPLGQSTRTRRVLLTLARGVTTTKQQYEVNNYLDSYNCWPPPFFILSITFIEIAIFAFYYYSENPRGDILTDCAGCFINHKVGPLMFVPQRREEVWRFFSYMLLHAGVSHLLGNVIMQLLVGLPLEIVHKVWRIGPIYLLAVLAGSLLQYALDPTVLLVGASAGVYALITAHLANVFINWSEMPGRYIRLGIVGAFLLFDIGGAVYRRVFADECDTVSHSAHIAGGIVGFCFGVLILYNIVEHAWERIVRFVCLGVLGLFFLVTICFAILQPPTANPIWKNQDCGANL